MSRNGVLHFQEPDSGSPVWSLKIMTFIVSSQIFYFSGHAGKRQVVPGRALALEEFAFY